MTALISDFLGRVANEHKIKPPVAEVWPDWAQLERIAP